MIDEDKTFEKFGYRSTDLSKGSNKKVWDICKDCKNGRWVRFNRSNLLCNSCARKIKNISYTTRQKLSKSKSGKNNPIYGMTGKESPRYGKTHSEESKQKMSIVQIGKIISEETKLKMSKNRTGMKHSEETKLKISIANSGKNSYMFGRTGNKHHNWNPNLTDEERQDTRQYPEYKKWRKDVYKRDKYTCQICGQISGILNAHHLEGYANNIELRTKLENGITLCKKCHKNFHHQYGFNNTKEQFIEFKAKKRDKYFIH